MIPIQKEKLIISPEDIKPSNKKLEILGTFNPGAARLPNGDIILYVRVLEKVKEFTDEKYAYSPRCEGNSKCNIIIDKFPIKGSELDQEYAIIFEDETKRLSYISHLRRVILDKTGFNIKFIDKKPSFVGLSEDGELGVEDARITKIEDKYYMTYVTLSRDENVSTSLAISDDCINWKRKGIIFREQNKDVVLFPEKINDKYQAFNRPEGNFEFTPPHIRLSTSKDLENWGHPKSIRLSQKGGWDYSRIGAGPPPIRTEKGWLQIYHGVSNKNKRTNVPKFLRKLLGVETEYSEYSAGAALYDLNNPEKLIAKSPKPILSPRKKYEKIGFVNNVIFPTGLVKDLDDKYILLYSGGADRVVTVKKILLKEILSTLKRV